MSGRDLGGTLRRHADRLLALPDVVGVAEGLVGGRPCILVLVERRTAELLARIPAVLDGFPTSIRETGQVVPLAEPASPHDPEAS